MFEAYTPYEHFDERMILEYQEKNPNVKIGDVIYDCLEEAILYFNLKPGTKLNANKIASQLNVSVTPVRSAIQRLAAKGFVCESDTGKTYSVFDISEHMLMQVLESLKMLEGSAAYLCAERLPLINMEHIFALAKKYQDLWLAYADGDLSLANRKQRFYYDTSFHEAIVEASGNMYLIDFYRSMKKMYVHVILRTFASWDTDNDVKNRRILAGQHMAICNGISTGIPDVARSAAENHKDFCILRCIVNRKY